MKRILLLALLMSFASADMREIKRKRTTLREGPGAYYMAIAELQEGQKVSIIQDDDQWPQVKVQNLQGYVSAKAFIGKPAAAETTMDPFAAMAGGPTPSTEISNAGVSAAVKGFAERFGKRLKTDPNFLEQVMGYQVDPRLYETFRKTTYGDNNPRKIHRRFDLPELPEDRSFTFVEEGSGIAIAAKLASIGLVNDRNLIAYVNYVGHHVAESSHGYDIPFRFFILDSEKVNGYACPGGIVFITRGALEIMENEAQLASFLGHEIAHVVYRHGMQEMEERKEMIIAGSAFDELNRKAPLEDEMEKTVVQLEDAFMDAYETIFAGRLADYEVEADAVGLVYAARAGYDPRELLALLKNFERSGRFAENEHYSASANALRMQRVEKLIDDNRQMRKAKGLQTFEQRFKTYVK